MTFATHKDFMRHLKTTIKRQPIPPKFNPKDWKEKRFNCYAYAMRACMDFRNIPDNMFPRPGFISKGELSDHYSLTSKYILKYFKKDCKALGLRALRTTLTEKLSENEYKIAVYCSECDDFHFIRQDSNGKWSEKDGWNKPINIVHEKEIEKDHYNYKFLGIFKVSKAG